MSRTSIVKALRTQAIAGTVVTVEIEVDVEVARVAVVAAGVVADVAAAGVDGMAAAMVDMAATAEGGTNFPRRCMR
jgi:hypothetical protein